MTRPTLEEQIRISKMTEEEWIEALLPHGFWQRLDFWMHNYLLLLWRIIHWDWFDVFEGLEDVDKYRPWYMKLKIKLFGGNKEESNAR